MGVTNYLLSGVILQVLPRSLRARPAKNDGWKEDDPFRLGYIAYFQGRTVKLKDQCIIYFGCGVKPCVLDMHGLN